MTSVFHQKLGVAEEEKRPVSRFHAAASPKKGAKPRKATFKDTYKAVQDYRASNKRPKETSPSPRTARTTGEKLARLPVQAGIGATTMKLLSNPQLAPFILQQLATPGAAQGELMEEEFFRRETPQSILDALDLPDFIRPVAEEKQQQLLQYLPEQFLPQMLAELPFKLAGLDMTPDNPWERGARTVGEFGDVLKSAPEALSALKEKSLSPLKRFLTGAEEKEANKLAAETFGQENLSRRALPLAEKAAERVYAQELKQAPMEGSALASRVSKGGKDVSPRPTASQRASGDIEGRVAPLQEHVGRKISSAPFRNEFDGGQSQIKAIQKVAGEMRQTSRTAYEAADKAYQGINAEYPELREELDGFIDRFLAGRKEELLNPAEKNVLNSVRSLRTFIATPKGKLKDVPVSALIKTADSWAAKLSHEDIYGDVKRLLGELIPQVNNSALRAIEISGGNPELMRVADASYGDWARRFANDEISPFLKREIFNAEQLFRTSLKDEGTYRAIHQALEGTAHESLLTERTSRHLVEKRLKPFFTNPSKVGSREYNEVISNLEPLIGENQTQMVDRDMRRMARTQKVPKIEVPEVKAAAKITKIPDEEFFKKMGKPSSIRDIKQKLSHSAADKKLFDNLKALKTRDIAQGGKIKADLSGADWFKTLNSRENFEVLSEFYGEENAGKLLDTFEKIGKKKVTKDNFKKVGKDLLSLKIMKALIHVI